MLLRRLVAALGPLLLCVLVCAVFRWLDGMIGAASFLAFLLKGALLGAALALTLPLAGIRARTNGLTGWLLLGAGILAVALAYQYLETEGAGQRAGAARRAVHQRTGGAYRGRGAWLPMYDGGAVPAQTSASGRRGARWQMRRSMYSPLVRPSRADSARASS